MKMDEDKIKWDYVKENLGDLIRRREYHLRAYHAHRKVIERALERFSDDELIENIKED